jgi:catechol 2,3-dioxygenase-like lactoylglutathione lyase family enzyme
MIIGFHHAAISTPDLDRSIRFYTDVVGCREAWAFSWDAGSEAADAMTGLKDSAARAVMLQLGESYLELFEFSSPVPQSGDAARPVCDHGITHICLQVRNLHEEHDRMKAAGMQFMSPPLTQETGYVVYGRDPDGNVVELIEFTDVPAQ